MKLKGLVILMVGFFLIFSAAGCAGNLQKNSHSHGTSPINTSYKDGTQVNQERKDILETKLQFAEELKNTDWWTSVQKNIQEQEYHVTYQGRTNLPGVESAYQAPNRAQNLRTYFTSDGISIVRRTEINPTWITGIRLESIGRAARLISLPKYKNPMVEGQRIEFRRDLLSEWYENGPRGLEQGFTINKKMDGSDPLILALKYHGNVKPEITYDGKAVEFFDSTNTSILRYSDLMVVDADGKKLSSHLEIVGSELRIIIDDLTAVYPIIVDPLITSPAWTLNIPPESVGFGYSVGSAGDVNGDGFSDVIVGAYECDYTCNDFGMAFVYYGSPTGPSTTPDWSIQSYVRGEWFGTIVGLAGDVNGDGYSDAMVNGYVYHGSSTGLSNSRDWNPYPGNYGSGALSSPAGDVNGDGFSDVIVAWNGKVYVHYGSLNGLGDSTDWTANLDASDGREGRSVGTAGDVNGDGYQDVIIATSVDIYVYYGSVNGLGSDGTPQNADWTAGISTHSFLNTVNTAGDINGDGYSDIIISVYGSVYVYLGSATGLESSYHLLVSGTWAVPTGDVNGDGYSDVLVSRSGISEVYYGSGSGLDDIPDLITSWSNSHGNGISTAGDVNGDGFSDVITGENVYRGSSSLLNSVSDWSGEGNQEESKYGYSVSAAGDVNGDGFGDVIVGAPDYDNGHLDEGRSYV